MNTSVDNCIFSVKQLSEIKLVHACTSDKHKRYDLCGIAAVQYFVIDLWIIKILATLNFPHHQKTDKRNIQEDCGQRDYLFLILTLDS